MQIQCHPNCHPKPFHSPVAANLPHLRHARTRQTHCKASQTSSETTTTQAVPAVLEYVPHGTARVQASSDQPPIVLLPGFGNNTADYVAPFGNESAGIVSALQARGFQVFVLDIQRTDWFKVARSLLSLKFYTTSCTTDPGYRWYLDRIHSTIQAAQQATGSDHVDLVGHSAGGWLGRAFLADPRYFGQECESIGCHSAVRTLCTLGTPHSPPPADRVRDMTGGALTWVNTEWPGAYHDSVRYISVAGMAVHGDEAAAPRTLGKYAHNSYIQVCGQGHQVCGDAVVPVQSALLEGAESVCLQGVFHSMSRVGTYSEASEYQWYGSDAVVDAWLQALVAKANQ